MTRQPCFKAQVFPGCAVTTAGVNSETVAFMKSRKIYILSIFLVIISLTGCDGRRLISDQTMIDHFNVHKKEFNELVKSYGEYGRDSMAWAARPDVIELKTKTGVGRIIDGAGYWFDDPYSLEAAKKLKEMRDNGKFAENHSRVTNLVKMADSKTHEALYFWNGNFNWKDYVYFPSSPNIEDGRIKLPLDLPEKTKLNLSWRVLDSLDSPEWKRGECVLRRIEPNWFLRRCRSR